MVVKPHQRRLVLLSLSTLALITYLDRLCISIAGPRMQRDLGLSPVEWGWIAGAFAVSYGAFEIPGGALGDRLGQRAVIARIVLWWSAFTVLTGAVSSFSALIAVRFLFGMGEAGAFPNISGALARWFPATERARAQGMVWGASRAGGILSPLVVIPLMAAFGWRTIFWACGLLGVVWVALWTPWYRNSPGHTSEPGAVPARGSHARVPWRAIVRSRQLWLIMLMYSCYGWGSYFYLSWLHTYLVKGRGLSESEMGIFSTLPFILGVGANPSGGWLSDRLVQRFGLRRGRRWVGASALAAASLCMVATALAQGRISSVLLISCGYGCMDLMLPSAWAICLDLAGEYSGAVSGAMNSAGHVGGFLSSVLFGYLVRQTGSYNAPLFAIAAMLLAAAVLFSRIDASAKIIYREASVGLPA